MYRHLKITSLKQMNHEIIKFLDDLLDINNSEESEQGSDTEPTQESRPKSAQKSIKDFIYSLNHTKKAGMSAVDEAVAYASGGAFANTQELINSFLRDLENNSGSSESQKKAFLKNYCDIDLDNADTGAITGADAGGSIVKTADSIVPETHLGPISNWSMPAGRSATFQGLTIIWPTTLTEIPDQAPGGTGATATVESQQQIIRALNTEWMESCLNLVVDSLGMSIEDRGATVRTISLKFINRSDRPDLAYVTTDYTGTSTRTTTYRLTLTFNMHYYSNLNDYDVNGSDLTSGQMYLDRTLAHELTHAVMSANIDNYAKLPTYIIEGMAELVHGIDDGRREVILELSDPSNSGEFRKMLEGEVDNIDNVVFASVYGGGFIFLRYLAKHSIEYEDQDDPDSTIIRRVFSKNGNNIMWLVTDPTRGGFSVWIGDSVKLRKRNVMRFRSRDIVELDYPWDDDSTVGASGRYKLDMWRKELDVGETAKAKAELRIQDNKAYNILMENAETPLDMRDAELVHYQNQLKIDEEIEQYEDKCHRVEATNPCHLGGILKYNEVPNTNGYKWLDCLYHDNSFMFSLYQSDIPRITRSLIIGEIEPYQEGLSGRSFIMSNSFIIKSYVNDSFFLEDIVGEGRIQKQQDAIAMGEDKIFDEPIEDYEDKKKTEAEIKSELDIAEADWKHKNEMAESQSETYDTAKYRAELARADADAETDPDAKAKKEAWADELEETANKLKDELDTMEADAAEAEQKYWDLYADYDEAKRNTRASYENIKDIYLNTFTPTLQAVPSKEGNYKHHISNCPAIDEVMTYNNEMFCAYRLDVDADSYGDAIYKDMGHYTAFHLHTAPKDLHLRYYDVSYRYYPPEELTSPRVVGWEHQLLHYTYESYESDVGANIYPLLDAERKEYEVWDSITETYKPFQFFPRSGTGGNSVNNVNNISTAIPLIFYVQRDDDENGNTWSATGQTDIVNYINMYNMSTGKMSGLQWRGLDIFLSCYNLWKRRMEMTPWNPVINDEDNQWTEVWGFGGYPGIAFKTVAKDDLVALRQRVVR